MAAIDGRNVGIGDAQVKAASKQSAFDDALVHDPVSQLKLFSAENSALSTIEKAAKYLEKHDDPAVFAFARLQMLPELSGSDLTKAQGLLRPFFLKHNNG